MAIATAVQRGDYVFAYNDQGGIITSIPCGTRPGDGLQGYTATTVSVKRDGWVFVYDERGGIITSILAQ